MDTTMVAFSEEALWRVEQNGHEAPPFNECPRHVPINLKLCGALHVDALQMSVHEFIRRHEVLRSTFRERHGRMYRRIVHFTPSELPIIDLRDIPVEGRERCLRERLTELAGAPFDLRNGPLYRIGLFRTAADEHVLSMTVHHIVFDAWSKRVLCQDLGGLYTAYRAGQQPTLLWPAASYADYVVWQRRPNGHDLAELLAGWTKRLEGVGDPASPAGALHRYRRTSTSSASYAIDATSLQIESLRTWARINRLTLTMALVMLFALVLHRIDGRTDITIGVPIVDRPGSRYQRVVGLFMNTLVVRMDFSGDPSLSVVCDRVRNAYCAALREKHLPYGYCVRHCPAPFRSVVSVVNLPEATFEFEGLTVTEIPAYVERPAVADITLFAFERSPELTLKFSYRAELFSPSEIARLADDVKHLISTLNGTAAGLAGMALHT
jgi:hypothetical protein